MPGVAEWVVELTPLPYYLPSQIQGIVGAVAGAAKRKQKASRIRSAGVVVSEDRQDVG